MLNTVHFDPWQTSLFVPPVSSANTKEKGPLLAGKSYSHHAIELHALNYHGTQLLVDKLSHSLSETLFLCYIILTSKVLLKCYYSNVTSELMSECRPSYKNPEKSPKNLSGIPPKMF